MILKISAAENKADKKTLASGGHKLALQALPHEVLAGRWVKGKTCLGWWWPGKLSTLGTALQRMPVLFAVLARQRQKGGSQKFRSTSTIIRNPKEILV